MNFILIKPLANHRIRAKEVRLIDENGKQVGVVPLQKALQMSQGRNLDLVQVTEKVTPPVCKIVELGKYLYHLKKKERKQSKHKSGGIKGIRLRFNTSPHDLETKAKQAQKFLEQGNKVKVELLLRGREKALRGHAQEQMDKFLNMVRVHLPIELDQPGRSRFNTITVIIKRGKKKPVPQKSEEKNEEPNEQKGKNQEISNQEI